MNNFPEFQVTFDAGDPHAQAEFWAEALSYAVEDNSERVQSLVDAGHLDRSAAVQTSRGLAFADVAACVDRLGTRPRLFFQRVPEGKVVKNRLHLDVHVGSERATAEVSRLLALGATHGWVSQDRGVFCTTLKDPEDNEFCVY